MLDMEMFMVEREVWEKVHNILRRRYGELTIITRQGVPKGQRVEIVDAGKRLKCVIKTSEGGRISFAHRPDGTWSGLSDADRVVVTGPGARSGELRVQMLDRKTLLKAFEANYNAQKDEGMEHLPCWISPQHEEGRGVRGTGDGFSEKALWSEVILRGGDEVVQQQGVTAEEEPITIESAKRRLAKKYGVRPDQIEITIRG
jgi:hypothetical protein